VKCGPGTIDDAFFRFVVDMGAPGPDRGAGGKCLILPPDDPNFRPFVNMATAASGLPSTRNPRSATKLL
jgi:hypothetical protein